MSNFACLLTAYKDFVAAIDDTFFDRTATLMGFA